jgi:hypothetical protein
VSSMNITRAMKTTWEGGPLTLGEIQSKFFLMRGGDSELQKKYIYFLTFLNDIGENCGTDLDSRKSDNSFTASRTSHLMTLFRLCWLTFTGRKLHLL